MPNLPEHLFLPNEHFDGQCPKCRVWEAPITPEELEATQLSKRIHVGSTAKELDPNAAYERFVWYERFICPRCGTRFSVLFSSV